MLQAGPMQTLASKSGNSYTISDLIITVRKFDPYTGYPSDDDGNTPKFTFFGDRCQQLDLLKPGDVVVVHFDIAGRAYDKDGKREYFTEVRPFRVDVMTGNTNQPQSFSTPAEQSPSQAAFSDSQPISSLYPPNPTPQASPAAPSELPKDEDDLPF